MKNNLLKKLPFVLALAALAPGFCATKSQTHNQDNTMQSSYDQGQAVQSNQMMSAYNSPARIDVEGAWDFFASGSFIYWQPSEQGLDLGLQQVLASGNDGTLFNMAPGKQVNMDFDFKPGFKAALGMNFNHDQWDALAEYTWLYMTDTKTYTVANAPSTLTVVNSLFDPSWVRIPSIAGNITYASGKWKLATNILDANFGRSFYVGTKFTARPHVGLRAFWIDQKYFSTYSTQQANVHYGSTSTQSSWALGLRSGFDSSYLIGGGFRVFGKAALCLAYQHFRVHDKEQTINNPSVLVSNIKNSQGYLTTNPEVNLGLGWGSYFANNSWHVDLAASYDFQVFFNQNMMRNLRDKIDGSSAPEDGIGNLFFQGLTVALRLDF